MNESSYAHPVGYNDTIHSYHGAAGSSFDVMNNSSSAYSSGKASPMTPIESSNSAGFPPTVGQGFDFHGPDRRLSNGFADLTDDYVMNGVNNNYLPPFPDRLGRFSNGATSALPPLHGLSRTPDVLRTVPPHVTQDFRENGYDDSQYSPHSEMSSRSMSGVDEQLARVGLRPLPAPGMSNDLHTFMK